MEPLFFLRKSLPLRILPVIDRANRSSLPSELKARALRTLFPPLLDWLEHFFSSAIERISRWGEQPVLRRSLSLKSHKIPNKAFSLLQSHALYGSELPFTDAFARQLRERYGLLHDLGLESPLDSC